MYTELRSRHGCVPDLYPTMPRRTQLGCRDSAMNSLVAMPPESASITVCVATFDRPQLVRRAIDSALAQNDPNLDVLVVNQGDPTTTAALNQRYADQPVSVIDAQPWGLSMSRNEAIKNASSTWIAFLDDDDRLLPNWSTILGRHVAPDVGLASCSARLESSEGLPLGMLSAAEPVALIEEVRGMHQAGCFVARLDLVRDVGGYLPGLNAAHQSELWIRLCAEIESRGMRVVSDEEVGTVITREPPERRRLANPLTQYEGGRWLLARHRTHLRRDRRRWANTQGVIAVNAARLGKYPEARVRSVRAAKADPRSFKRWLRVLATAFPFVARRIWTDASTFDHLESSQTLDLVRRLAPELPERQDDLLFLPWEYQTNQPSSSDRDGTPFWGETLNDVRYQVPVYRWAASLLRKGRVSAPVLDVGCGSGEKLITHIASVTEGYLGIDQPSGIASAQAKFPHGHWQAVDLASSASDASLSSRTFDLVICADVIEHVPDPHQLLAYVRRMIAPGGRAIISTPDRDRLEKATGLGPPHNPRHIREWNAEEFELLLSSHGFEVLRARHLLPRSYSPTVLDAKIAIHRLLHGKAVPDRRSCMAYLVKPTQDVPR